MSETVATKVGGGTPSMNVLCASAWSWALVSPQMLASVTSPKVTTALGAGQCGAGPHLDRAVEGSLSELFVQTVELVGCSRRFTDDRRDDDRFLEGDYPISALVHVIDFQRADTGSTDCRDMVAVVCSWHLRDVLLEFGGLSVSDTLKQPFARSRRCFVSAIT